MFAGMDAKVEEAFGVKFQLSGLSVVVYLITSLITGLAANLFLTRYGIRKSTIVGSIMVAVGSLIRTLLGYDFRLVILG